MEAARLPFTLRNVLAACASLLTTAGYWWLLRSFNAEAAEQNKLGYEGEASFIVLIPLLFLLLYSGVWSLVLGGQALQRDSEPVSSWQLLLGLLPAGLLLPWMLL